MKNNWFKTKEYIKIDIYRNRGTYNYKLFFKEFLFSNSTVSLLIYFRLCHYFCGKKKNFVEKIIHACLYLKFKRLQSRCGIEINQHTNIGCGLRLPHKGGIVIHPSVVIGDYCEIMQGVTLGNNILKSRNDVPSVGDEVLICAGAKVIGKVNIGNVVVIGANSVVNKDIDDNSIVAGIPAKFIKKCDNSFVINKK